MANNTEAAGKKKLPILGLVGPIQFIMGILLAFIGGALFLWVFRENVGEAYSALFKGAFGSKRYIGEALLSTTP